MITKIIDMTKRKNIFQMLIIVLLISSVSSFAQSPDELMAKANKFYQEQNYSAAIEVYQKILAQGFESGALYYNLGNAYFKSSQLGNAIYSYEKGLKLEPNDDDLVYNLRIANARTVDKFTELPKLFIISWIEGMVTSLGITGWSILVVITFWVLLGSLALYFFSKSSRLQRISFTSGSTSLSLLIVFCVLLFARVGRESATDYGILLSSTYSAKVSPDSKSNDVFVIHEGIKFTIEDKVNDWVKIRLVDGKIGWIQNDSFGQI